MSTEPENDTSGQDTAQDPRALIAELRATLAETEVDDAARRERLDRIVERLDERLASGPPHDHHQLAEELREDAMEFAVEHPDLAATLRSFMRMLSSIGI